MMETNPYDYYEQCRFDAFCKAVLRNEARAYLRNMKRQRNRELTFSDLSQEELDKLYAVDRYPSDSFVFSAHGYELHIDNELVAEAFAKLSKTEQSILILHCVLDMADGEIGSLMGMSRSAVQRHRAKTLKALRVTLMALLSVSKAACAGDSGAVECVLRYYDDYMNKLCTRTLYDKAGYPHVCVDEYMKRRMEIRLIQAMMKP